MCALVVGLEVSIPAYPHVRPSMLALSTFLPQISE